MTTRSSLLCMFLFMCSWLDVLADTCDQAERIARRAVKLLDEEKTAVLQGYFPPRISPAKWPSSAMNYFSTIPQLWNSLVKDEWDVGPRMLSTESQSGNVVGGSRKGWIGSIPPGSKAVLHLRKTDGKGRATITVCAVPLEVDPRAKQILEFEVRWTPKTGRPDKV